MKKTITICALLAALLCGCKPSTENTAMNKDFLELAHERYSVRSFSDQKVPQDIIDKILEAGMVSPTAVNSQPQMIYVIQSPEAMAKLNEQSRCIYGAPQAFLVCYNEQNACQRGEYGSYGEIDATIVLTHMTLEAANLGIGTCIVGMFDQKEIAKAFELPSYIKPVLLLPFGYPAEDAAPSAKHTEYRPLEETVQYL
ncbi:MAG: nitroreductase family protein [Bacteroidia bacterium]|nr:nitroreductase family protein [Bacteroidia bacterium]